MPTSEVDYLLIGGGLASASAAQTLRQEGAEGTIMLVGREPDPPYHRPPCSKEYLRGTESREDTFVCPLDWYTENEVQLKTRTSVTALDMNSRRAMLSSKEEVTFDKALIATGANVRRLNAPGCELEEIHYLRALANADAIRRSVEQAESVVLIGGSYIGCEVAASLTQMGKHCSIVMQESVPLERGFGRKMGSYFQEILRSHGIDFYPEDELESFAGEERVSKVLTKRGHELAAQTVVIGAGVIPDVRLAQQAGLEISQSGGVRCDAHLESSAAGVYVAGDICEYDSRIHGRRIRVEHWDVANSQGRTAALNMLGRDTSHEIVPYFFSDLADWASLEYLGPAYEWDREIIRGSTEQGNFSNWYLKDNRVLGVLQVGQAKDLDHARELIRKGVTLSESQLAAIGDPGSDLENLDN